MYNSKKSIIFAPDDNDIDYRTADTTAGHDARLSLRILHARRNVSAAPEILIGLCLWRDGGCIGMVAADSSDGDVLNG